MKTTITQSDFRDAFLSSDSRKNSFSWEGLNALFDYLEALEQDCGEEMELDVVALDCDFTEYQDLKDVQDNFPQIESLEDLQDHTQVIEIEGTDRLIIQNF